MRQGWEKRQAVAKSRYGACLLFVLLLLVQLALPASADELGHPGQGIAAAPQPYQSEAWPQEERNMRVALTMFPGLYGYDSRGDRTGYVYDCLQFVRGYLPWHFEYHDFAMTDSWASHIAALRQGDVDLLANMHRTPEREQEFIFSRIPMGIARSVLLCRNDDERFSKGDYTACRGQRIGMVREYYRAEELMTQLGTPGTDYTPVEYESVGAAYAALREGEVELILMSSVQPTPTDMRIVESSNGEPVFFMMRADEQEYMHELERAMLRLDRTQPEWSSEAYKRYYDSRDALETTISPTERDFLQQFAQSGQVLRVVVMPQQPPYAFWQDGAMDGILVDLLAATMERLELPYTLLRAETPEAALGYIESGEADIILGSTLDLASAESAGFRLSSPLLHVGLGRLQRRGYGSAVERVAMTRAVHTQLTRAGLLPLWTEVQVFDDFEAAVTAVRSGACDALEAPLLTLQDYLHKDSRNDLELQVLTERELSMTFAVRNGIDPRLVSLLQHAVPTVSDPAYQHAFADHMHYSLPPSTWENFVSSHPQQFVVMALLVIMSIAGASYNILRIRNNRKFELRRQELEAFLRYACMTNELVSRVDLDSRTAIFYRLGEDGHVVIEERPWVVSDYVGKLVPEEQPRWEDDGDLHIAMVQAIREGRQFQCEEHMPGPNGTLRYLHVIFQPIHDPRNRRTQYIYFRYDNTQEVLQERQQKEALIAALANAEEASKAKETFLSSMSHEIRTPLNAIIGYLDLVDRADVPLGKIRHAIHNARVAANTLLMLINNVLDMNAIGRGKIQVSLSPMNLQELLTELQTIFQGQADVKQITLTLDSSSLLRAEVMGDQLHLRQVCSNIISNALKFTPKGGEVTVQVEQVRQVNDVYLTTFIFRDTGIGMSQAELEKLYKPFEQANARTRQQYGGSGLGMSIAWNLVKLMHGNIQVESTPGEGTTYHVTLPLQAAKAPTEPQAEAEEVQAVPGVHLLVVDDNEMNREITQAILEQRGYTVDTAVNGQEAVERFEQAPEGTYQGVLMDVQMPIMDGCEATKAIRHSAHPQAASICIIGLSADVFADDVAKGIACGMNDYISKPVDAHKLATILARCLRGAKH